MDIEYSFSRPIKKSVSQLFIKRTFDICFSLFVLIFFAPVFVVIALVVKISDSGPAFFTQKRVGLNGCTFKCFKFRTMIVDADRQMNRIRYLNEVSGPVFKIKNDPRITRAGKFLRKSGLDELPQFFNVLKGEMSVVGPRPPVPTEVAQYNDRQMKRLSIKPGITCTWQVCKKRNEIPFARWIEMDLDYIENGNLWTDIKIIVKTVRSVFSMSGY